MKFHYPTFRVQKTDHLKPDDSRAGDIFSRLGYKLWDAVADLVDNSVDAGATNVLVRFVRSADGVHSVLIVDNGHGMDSAELKEAMRFGSKLPKNSKQLGKYGIGLKSASLSQAEVVTVLSKRAGCYSGRRWTLKNIKAHWKCEVLVERDVQAVFKGHFGEITFKPAGTIIIWEQLEHLRALPQNLDKVLEHAIDQLAIELGIRFHRFIEAKRLSVSIDQQFAGESEPLVRRNVTALNPFAYDASGHVDYPVPLTLKLGTASVVAHLHVWPPKSRSPGYRLGGGKVALRQGFYFYRNDRVIQAGGWNGLRADDGEPHLSLARVCVDLPAAVDSMFKLDVTKSTLDPTPQFHQALLSAKRGDVTMSRYLDDAQRAYRKQKRKDAARFPYIPGSGLPARARKAIEAILSEKGTGRTRKVQLRWAVLDPDELVAVDPEGSGIILNSSFRKRLDEGRTGDAPALKMALLFLLQDELAKTFTTKKASNWLQRVNQALIAAMKREG